MMQATTAGRMTAWSLLGVLSAANVTGCTLDVYQRFWWFDRILHTCTIFAVTLWLIVLVFGPALNRQGGHGILIVLLVASFGTALGSYGRWRSGFSISSHLATSSRAGTTLPSTSF